MLDRLQLLQIVERVATQAGAQTAAGRPLDATLLLHGDDGWRHEVLEVFDASTVGTLAHGNEDAYICLLSGRDVPLRSDGLAVVAATRDGVRIYGTASETGWSERTADEGTLGAVSDRLAAILLDDPAT